MTDWILQHLADRLGVAPPQAGEATTPQIRFEQPWPQWLLLAVVLGSVGSGHLALPPRRKSLARLQIVPGRHPDLPDSAAWSSCSSEAVLSVKRTGLPYLTIMIDDSASERISRPVRAARDAGRPGGPGQGGRGAPPASGARLHEPGTSPAQAGHAEATRLEIAKGLILRDNARLIRELRKAAQGAALPGVQFGPFAGRGGSSRRRCAGGGEAAPRSMPTGSQSRLGDGIRQVLTELRGAPPSAIVLLTDGQTTEGEPLSKAAELAARKGVPLFTIGLGSAEPARDLELTELLVDDVVFVDDAVRFQAKLLARGFPGPEGRRPAQGASSRAAATPGPTASSNRSRSRPRPTGSRSGSSWCIAPRPPASAPSSSRSSPGRASSRPRTTGSSVPITVRKEKLKVLIVDSEPRYEFRYLKNYLEREETIDLNVVLLSSDPEYSEQDRSALPTFPAAKEELFAYDVVIVGDADTGFPEPFADAEPGRVRHREGGRHPVHRRRARSIRCPTAAHRWSYSAADRAGRGPQSHGGGQRRSARTGPS